MLYVDKSEGRGLGVFARHFIGERVLMDVSYSWLLSPDDIDLYDRTSLSGRWFDVPDREGYGLLPIGLAALLNHSSKPNAKLVWTLAPQFGYIGVLTSIQNILTGEEVFIDYGIEMPVGWR